MIDDEALNIYTDGSCQPNPGPGGVGILFVTVNDEGNNVCYPAKADIF